LADEQWPGAGMRPTIIVGMHEVDSLDAEVSKLILDRLKADRVSAR
jgi:hypothetical protein